MMIGRVREKDGLYYLEAPGNPSVSKKQKLLSFFSEHSLTNKDRIWLHNLRLGPSFGDLKVMFPSLFKGLDSEIFHCDVCELAKHKRVSFPVRNKRRSIPFALSHSDIWGPSTIPNISGAKWFVSFIDDCTIVTWIILLKSKSDVSSVVLNVLTMIKNQFSVHN